MSNEEETEACGKREVNAMEKEFWKKIHVKCQYCIHECKQSSKVTILNCPDFKNKNKV